MKNSKKILLAIHHIPRLNLSFLPTPLHKLENVSRLHDANIYCKRDDLTGFAFGGNKTRKLDFLIRDAITRGADCIVTYGSQQSNWCRITAAAGARYGLKVYLVLAGKENVIPTGNLLLDHLAGAEIHNMDSENDDVLAGECMHLVDKLKTYGKNPYYLKVGGSTTLGTMAYVAAFVEIMEYTEATGTVFDSIFVAAGSGGTQAGLVAGKMLCDWPGQIVGINVSRDEKEQKELVKTILKGVFQYLGREVGDAALDKAVINDDHYIGEGYGRKTEACTRAISLFAGKEGIFLDEVYTGKAAAGMIDYIISRKTDGNKNILFVHTGGNIQLFQ